MQLTEIVYYPVKSMRGLNAEAADIRHAGMPHDREWLVATPDGMFLTARKLPHMLLWQAEPHSSRLPRPPAAAAACTTMNSPK